MIGTQSTASKICLTAAFEAVWLKKLKRPDPMVSCSSRNKSSGARNAPWMATVTIRGTKDIKKVNGFAFTSKCQLIACAFSMFITSFVT